MQNNSPAGHPPLRSVKRIGLLFTARITAGYVLNKHSDIWGPQILHRHRYSLKPGAIAAPLLLIRQANKEKPIRAARSRGDSSVSMVAEWRYPLQQAWSQFQPEYFCHSTRASHFQKELPVIAVRQHHNNAARIMSRFAGLCPAARSSNARMPGHEFQAFPPLPVA